MTCWTLPPYWIPDSGRVTSPKRSLKGWNAQQSKKQRLCSVIRVALHMSCLAQQLSLSLMSHQPRRGKPCPASSRRPHYLEPPLTQQGRLLKMSSPATLRQPALTVRPTLSSGGKTMRWPFQLWAAWRKNTSVCQPPAPPLKGFLVVVGTLSPFIGHR